MKNIENILINCERELREINEELKSSPEGHLGIKRSYYYQVIKRKPIGITKDTTLIRKLCRKKYLLARKAQLENNISKSLSEFDFRTPKELIASFSKAYQSVPEDYFHHPSIVAWQAKTFEKNTIDSEGAKYISTNGTELRTMSEWKIAEQLESYGLPYHYDTIIYLNGRKKSPDFIIKNPFTNKTFIWEYFGAFDQKGYSDYMNNKMDLYMKAGFIPSENLIVTYQYHLRDTRRIQNLIEDIIL